MSEVSNLIGTFNVDTNGYAGEECYKKKTTKIATISHTLCIVIPGSFFMSRLTYARKYSNKTSIYYMKITNSYFYLFVYHVYSAIIIIFSKLLNRVLGSYGYCQQ